MALDCLKHRVTVGTHGGLSITVARQPHAFLASGAALSSHRSWYISSPAEFRVAMSPSCPSPRWLGWGWCTPAPRHPWCPQPGYWRLVRGFDLSCTTARSRFSWEVVLQSTSKSLNSIFTQKWLNS